MLLLIFISYSCSTNDMIKNESTNDIDYSGLNKSVDNQISGLSKLIKNANSEDQYLKYFKTRPIEINNKKIIPKEKFVKIKLAPHYNKKENEFMLSFYEDLANSYDSQIINLLNAKRALINKSKFSKNFKNETNFIFNTIEKTNNKIVTILDESQSSKTNKTSGFVDCVAKDGKNFGRNIATGALVGAAGGAILGAGGGTIVLPGVGTAAGAVGGAVYGAAKGAVSAGLITLTWAFIDCAMERKGLEITYVYMDNFYNEIIFPNDDDQFEFYNFDYFDPLTNAILFTPDETIIKFIE